MIGNAISDVGFDHARWPADRARSFPILSLVQHENNRFVERTTPEVTCPRFLVQGLREYGLGVELPG